MKTPLLIAIMALAGNAFGAPMPSWYSPDFVGPLLPDQQRELDAWKNSQNSGVLNVIQGPCIPWHPPCKMPEEGKKEDLQKEGTVKNEGGWTKVPGGWMGPDGKVYDPATNPNIPPVLAEKKQKELDAQKKAYDDANAKMWGNNTQSGGGSTATRAKSTVPEGAFGAMSAGLGAGAGAGAADPFEVDGQYGGETEAGIRSIADDALGGQPDNSPLWTGEEPARPEGEKSLGQGLSALAANMTDNGAAVSVGSPGGSRGASPDKVSAIAQLHQRAKPQPKGGSTDTIMDWLTSAWTFDQMKAGTAAAPVDPSYKNSAFFGQQPSRAD